MQADKGRADRRLCRTRLRSVKEIGKNVFMEIAKMRAARLLWAKIVKQFNPKNPKTPDYEVPKDFALDDYVASFPWQHRFHERIEVELELRGQLTALAEKWFPGSPSTGVL